MKPRLNGLMLGTILGVLWLNGGSALADGDAPAAKEAAAAHEGATGTPLDEQTRKKWAASGFLMLGGIVFLGLVLVVVAMRWGSMARRLARQPLPPAGRGDELWFLKPHKTPCDEAHDPGRESPPAGDSPQSDPDRPQP